MKKISSSVKKKRVIIQWELVLLIYFTIFDVLIFGSRVFFNLYPLISTLEQLILIKDRQQFKS